MTKYRIAEISIEQEADGRLLYWIGYYGFHADQGGNVWRWGETGMSSLEDALTILGNMMPEGLPKIEERLKELKGDGK